MLSDLQQCPSNVQIILSGLKAETAVRIRLPLDLCSTTACSTTEEEPKFAMWGFHVIICIVGCKNDSATDAK